jgi:hypothetical protein
MSFELRDYNENYIKQSRGSSSWLPACSYFTFPQFYIAIA